MKKNTRMRGTPEKCNQLQRAPNLKTIKTEQEKRRKMKLLINMQQVILEFSALTVLYILNR